VLTFLLFPLLLLLLVVVKIRGGFEGQKPIAVAAGRHHTAVLTSKGGVWTFGCGENGTATPTSPPAAAACVVDLCWRA
jgi:hypothetical protein